MFACAPSDPRNAVGQHHGSLIHDSVVAVCAVLLLAFVAGCGGDDGSSPPVDTTPPSRVTNLAVTAVTDSSATLGWSAPGDDGTTGTAQAYQIRWSSTNVSEANWASATQVPNPPTPKAAGSAESYTVRGLAPRTLCYFALKAVDEAGNASLLSNVASDTTSGGTPPVRPELAVSPAQLDFGEEENTLRLNITNAGTGILNWTVTDDQPWMIVQPTIGSTTSETDEVTVTVYRGGQSVGTHAGTVTVTPNPGEAFEVPVTMSVAVPPVLVLSTHDLDFGSTETAQTFTISNGGAGTLTWTITDERAWLSASPTDGSTSTDTTEVTVTISRAGLSTGHYMATLIVTPLTGAPQEVAVQMSVVDGGGGFVLVEPGTFTMGSPADEPGRGSDEAPREVTLTKAIHVAIQEVTQADWEAMTGWNDSDFEGVSRPVEQVTWFDALRYCNQRSASDGYTPAYTIENATYEGHHITYADVAWNQGADGYRLPTEAEWEYACRAGTTTAFGNGTIVHVECSPLDPNLDLLGWYCGNALSSTHEVGGKATNAWGLQDMHGNVWEWCWDWYGNYPATPETDPIGPTTGTHRVRRGGGCFAEAAQCRSANRGYNAGPTGRSRDLGLRLVRTAD